MYFFKWDFIYDFIITTLVLRVNGRERKKAIGRTKSPPVRRFIGGFWKFDIILQFVGLPCCLHIDHMPKNMENIGKWVTRRLPRSFCWHLSNSPLVLLALTCGSRQQLQLQLDFLDSLQLEHCSRHGLFCKITNCFHRTLLVNFSLPVPLCGQHQA